VNQMIFELGFLSQQDFFYFFYFCIGIAEGFCSLYIINAKNTNCELNSLSIF